MIAVLKVQDDDDVCWLEEGGGEIDRKKGGGVDLLVRRCQ